MVLVRGRGLVPLQAVFQPLQLHLGHVEVHPLFGERHALGEGLRRLGLQLFKSQLGRVHLVLDQPALQILTGQPAQDDIGEALSLGTHGGGVHPLGGPNGPADDNAPAGAYPDSPVAVYLTVDDTVGLYTLLGVDPAVLQVLGVEPSVGPDDPVILSQHAAGDHQILSRLDGAILHHAVHLDTAHGPYDSAPADISADVDVPQEVDDASGGRDISWDLKDGLDLKALPGKLYVPVLSGQQKKSVFGEDGVAPLGDLGLCPGWGRNDAPGNRVAGDATGGGDDLTDHISLLDVLDQTQSLVVGLCQLIHLNTDLRDTGVVVYDAAGRSGLRRRAAGNKKKLKIPFRQCGELIEQTLIHTIDDAPADQCLLQPLGGDGGAVAHRGQQQHPGRHAVIGQIEKNSLIQVNPGAGGGGGDELLDSLGGESGQRADEGSVLTGQDFFREKRIFPPPAQEVQTQGGTGTGGGEP